MRIPQTKINREYKKAKKRKKITTMQEHGYLFCESCRGTFGLSPSHIISQADCKAYDLLELIYDVDNLRWHCMDIANGCHNHWENGTKFGNDTLENINWIVKVLGDDEKYKPLLEKYKQRWEAIIEIEKQ